MNFRTPSSLVREKEREREREREMGKLRAFKRTHTLFTGQRERKREGGRESEKE
jgi:hypothetical protein